MSAFFSNYLSLQSLRLTKGYNPESFFGSLRPMFRPSRPSLSVRKLSLIASSVLALLFSPVHAELTIEITGAGASRIPVAIADFGGEPGTSRALTSVVRGDL